MSSNLAWVSASYNLPCVSLFPDIPGANMSITMFGASQSRHKPTNSWLHTDNLPTILHQYKFKWDNSLSNQHMVNLSTGTISNLLHMDSQLNYNREQTKEHHSHP
jgi:hypothetical protein